MRRAPPRVGRGGGGCFTGAMTSSRLLRLVPAFVLALGLSACSDDESSNSAAEDATQVEETEQGCDAKVKVTGDVKAKWKAEGFTILQDGSDAFYKTSDKKLALSIFPAADDLPARAVFTAKGDSYTTQDDAKKVEADPEGGGAKVNATATGIGPGSAVKIKATINCGSD